jgi:hypothetical protein
MSRIYLNILCARQVVSQKTDFFCVVCKKYKLLVLKKLFTRISFTFIIEDTQKIPVYPETWHAHIEYRDVHAKFLFQTFKYYKMFFQRQEHIHRRSKVDFRLFPIKFVRFYHFHVA